MIRSLVLLVLLCGCASDLPPPSAAISAESLNVRPPRVIPLAPVLRAADMPSRARAAQATLDARGDALSRRAAVPQPATGDLAERGRLLRQRADRLRDGAL